MQTDMIMHREFVKWRGSFCRDKVSLNLQQAQSGSVGCPGLQNVGDQVRSETEGWVGLGFGETNRSSGAADHLSCSQGTLQGVVDKHQTPVAFACTNLRTACSEVEQLGERQLLPYMKAGEDTQWILE